MHNIQWNNFSLDSYGVRIERSPEIIRPRRKYDVLSIPGRNGDFVLMQDAWENYIQPYEVFIGDGSNLSAETTANTLSYFLHSANGYALLEDTFEPNIYRYAYYVDETDIYNGLTQYGRTTLRFNCRPERYLRTSEEAVQNGDFLTGPYSYLHNGAKPRIIINAGGVSWGGTFKVVTTDKTYELQLTGVQGRIILYCEEQDATNNNGDNLNDKVTILQGDSYPRLDPNGSTITWTISGTSPTVSMDPRWFYI